MLPLSEEAPGWSCFSINLPLFPVSRPICVSLVDTPTSLCLSQSADMRPGFAVTECTSLKWCTLILFEPVHTLAPRVSAPVNFKSVTEQSSYCPKQQQPPRSIHTDSAYELFRCSHHLLKMLGLQGFLQSVTEVKRLASSPQKNLPSALVTSLEGKTLKQLLAIFGSEATFAPYSCLKKLMGCTTACRSVDFVDL